MRGWKKSRAPTRFVWDWGLWCDKVTEQVRFRPDRETIRQELLAHLEDSAADWERRGETPKEAEQRALEAMGYSVPSFSSKVSSLRRESSVIIW